MSLEIIRAGEGELQGIRAVEEACFSRPWSEESLRSELDNGRSALFAAKDGGKIVGWAGMTWVLDEGSVSDIAADRGFMVTPRNIDVLTDKQKEYLGL